MIPDGSRNLDNVVGWLVGLVVIAFAGLLEFFAIRVMKDRG